MNTGKTLLRTFTVIIPLGLTPLWGWLIAEGYLNFGGGEKDLLLLIPWLLWASIYTVVSVVMWVRKVELRRSIMVALGISTATLVLLWVVLFVFSVGWLGVRG